MYFSGVWEPRLKHDYVDELAKDSMQSCSAKQHGRLGWIQRDNDRNVRGYCVFYCWKRSSYPCQGEYLLVFLSSSCPPILPPSTARRTHYIFTQSCSTRSVGGNPYFKLQLLRLSWSPAWVHLLMRAIGFHPPSYCCELPHILFMAIRTAKSARAVRALLRVLPSLLVQFAL